MFFSAGADATIEDGLGGEFVLGFINKIRIWSAFQCWRKIDQLAKEAKLINFINLPKKTMEEEIDERR